MSPAPDVPTETLDRGGWSLTEESTETLFSLPTARVEGHTLLYEDLALRETLEGVTGVDQIWRFLFTTAVSFTPPLAPGIGPAMISPSVSSEAKRRFADDLRDRGFENVSRGKRERMRSRTGGRIRLQEFTADLPIGGTTVDVTGWLGVWTVGGDFRIGGGAYPDLGALATALDVDDGLGPAPGECRTQLFSVLREVG